jgi:hypothetical protein
MSTSPSPTPDDNDSIRHVYFPHEFWVVLDTHFRRPTRYSVRQLIVELALTEEYFEHIIGGTRNIYNNDNKPENISTHEATPVVTLRDGSILIVPYDTVHLTKIVRELPRERHLQRYDSDSVNSDDGEE